MNLGCRHKSTRSCSPHTSQNFLTLQEGYNSAPFNIFLDFTGRYYILYSDYPDSAGKSRPSTSKYPEQTDSAGKSRPSTSKYPEQTITFS